MTGSIDGRSQFRRINSAILQFLLDGERGRNQVAADVSRMVGVHISASALLVIERLRGGSMRVNDLGAVVGLTSGGITRQLQDLEAKELVEKKPDETDRRAAIVGLSPNGEEVVRLADAIRDFSTRRALREWTDEDIDRVAPLLERLADGLRRAAGVSVFDAAPVRVNVPVEELIRLLETEGCSPQGRPPSSRVRKPSRVRAWNEDSSVRRPTLRWAAAEWEGFDALASQPPSSPRHPARLGPLAARQSTGLSR